LVCHINGRTELRMNVPEQGAEEGSDRRMDKIG
jgi:hypothetical protein